MRTVFSAASTKPPAGVEALNGLLLLGWSVCFTCLAMERFWKVTTKETADDDPS